MNWELVVGNIAGLLVVFAGAAWATVLGFQQWLKQRQHERRDSFSEHLLAQFYEARAIIESARYPGSSDGEGETREPVEGETEGEARMRNAYYVPAERLLRERKFFAGLEASKYRFMALFGEKGAEPFDLIKGIRIRVIHSSAMLVRLYRESNDRAGTLRSDIERLEADIGYVVADPDSLAAEVDDAVAKIEQVCKPFLGRRG